MPAQPCSNFTRCHARPRATKSRSASSPMTNIEWSSSPGGGACAARKARARPRNAASSSLSTRSIDSRLFRQPLLLQLVPVAGPVLRLCHLASVTLVLVAEDVEVGRSQLRPVQHGVEVLGGVDLLANPHELEA